MIHFTTPFDIRFLPRGLALYQSLVDQKTPFFLWMLCLDSESAEIVKSLKLKNTGIVTLDDLRNFDSRVQITEGNRSRIAFYFTMKSFLCKYIFEKNPDIELLIYLDADIFFFGDPAYISNLMKGYSVAITPHHFPKRLEWINHWGHFNAGFMAFRNDTTGLSCLNWWTDQCFSWCHDYYEDGKFCDQLYLDQMPEKFQNVLCVESKGVNLAPWNIDKSVITSDASGTYVDGEPLIFFHFHKLHAANDGCFETHLFAYKTKLTKNMKKMIYIPYIKSMEAMRVKLSLTVNKKTLRYHSSESEKFSVYASLKKIIKKTILMINSTYYQSSICLSQDIKE